VPRAREGIKTLASGFHWAAAQGWTVVGVVESPVLGPQGNREFLLYACRSGIATEEKR
jgi:23S rRNA (cytidine1920-2'-O)/16S rRNA (cytidine1409-2'-O)-methyltransferase